MSTLPAVAEKKGIPQTFKQAVSGKIDRFRQALPAHISAERIVSQLTVCVHRTPKLQQCDRNDVILCALRAASLGLELEPSLGEAYLIPRKDWNLIDPRTNKKGVMTCTFMPGYRGLRKLVLQTGKVGIFEAHLVFEGDEFDYDFSPSLRLHYKPCRPWKRGELMTVFSRAKLDSGEWSIDEMGLDDIEKIHKLSEGYKYALREKKDETGPWVDHLDEMRLKTVVRHHSKALPSSPELAGAFSSFDAFHRGEAPPPLLDAPRPQAALTVASTDDMSDDEFMDQFVTEAEPGQGG